jgi:ribulose-5-phosphate 4-epimerase/fuculose-1-phosphate aldolase
MANHGAISVGSDLGSAYAATLAAEDTARMVCLLRAMNAPIHALPPETTARLRSAYLEKYRPTKA